MKNKLTIALLYCFSLALIGCQGKVSSNLKASDLMPTPIDSLQAELNAVNATRVLPGFAVSVFSADTILYQQGFGYSDLEKEKPYTVDNVQIIASITKTLVGVALMKALEENLMELDEDINDVLPYRVVNPKHPMEKITPRMLATHSSSIVGTKLSDKGYRFETPLLASKFPEAYRPLLANYNKTEDITMSDFLQEKLSVQGKWYETEVFSSDIPGSNYEYSNLGMTLLAHIIELKTKESFNEFTRKLILDPLKMNSSFWDIGRVPENRQVIYYNELKEIVPNYYIVTYPDGGLYSSVADMTLYLQEMMRGYEGESAILPKSAFREMMKKQIDGLCWDLSFEGLIGHSGNDFGTATLMYFNPQTGIGRILFTNISIETEAQEDAFYGIFNTLFEYDFKS